MKRIIIFSPSRVWVEGASRLMSVDELLAQQWSKAGPLLVAVMPTEVGRVLATVRTLDSAVTQQYPGENSYSTLLLEPNVYQVYVAPDEQLNRLRKMARDVHIVPFPAAVVTEVMGASREKSFIERTQVFLNATALTNLPEDESKELVVIDPVDDEYLITAIRQREVVAVRLVQGDIVTELQRTLAGTRMDAPTIVCRDEDLSLDLRAVGFTADLSPGTGLIGAEAMKKVGAQRFLNQWEVAQRRQAQSRRKALTLLLVSVVLCGIMAAGWLLFGARQALARRESDRLTGLKDEQMALLVKLNQERYGTLAQSQSLQIREELFDLGTSLPPQVVLLSVRKDERGLSAVVERRPQAAPFSRDDLRLALAASPAFAKAEIAEEYEGHLVRYLLRVAPLQPPLPPPAAPPQ